MRPNNVKRDLMSYFLCAGAARFHGGSHHRSHCLPVHDFLLLPRRRRNRIAADVCYHRHTHLVGLGANMSHICPLFIYVPCMSFIHVSYHGDTHPVGLGACFDSCCGSVVRGPTGLYTYIRCLQIIFSEGRDFLRIMFGF